MLSFLRPPCPPLLLLLQPHQSPFFLFFHQPHQLKHFYTLAAQSTELSFTGPLSSQAFALWFVNAFQNPSRWQSSK